MLLRTKNWPETLPLLLLLPCDLSINNSHVTSLRGYISDMTETTKTRQVAYESCFDANTARFVDNLSNKVRLHLLRLFLDRRKKIHF
jgi:hypothetical protein